MKKPIAIPNITYIENCKKESNRQESASNDQ